MNHATIVNAKERARPPTTHASSSRASADWVGTPPANTLTKIDEISDTIKNVPPTAVFCTLLISCASLRGCRPNHHISSMLTDSEMTVTTVAQAMADSTS